LPNILQISSLPSPAIPRETSTSTNCAFVIVAKKQKEAPVIKGEKPELVSTKIN
jgi:hypothetical protein